MPAQTPKPFFWVAVIREGSGIHIINELHKDTPVFLVKTGNPNPSGTGLPTWHPYIEKDRATTLFDVETQCVNDPIREARVVLDKILNP